MINDVLLERLGRQRLQEELRLAERQRLVRQAQKRSRGSVWAKAARALAKDASTADGGGRISPDAPRAGEMPGL